MKIKYPKVKVSKKHWQFAVAVISTLHYPHGSAAWAFEPENWNIFTNGESLMLRTDIGHLDVASGVTMEAGDEDAAVEVMINLLAAFRALGYDYVRFDQDGDVIQGLPQYE